MVERPVDLIKVEWRLQFNGLQFEALEIDLVHINTGKKQTRASSYSVSDAVFIFDNIVNGAALYPVDARKYNGILTMHRVKK